MKQKLYPWQEKCLNKWFANHSRGMVQAVTGSGKTLLALHAADQLEQSVSQDLRIKIVVPTSALMYQWQHALKEFLADKSASAFSAKKDIGLRGAGHTSLPDCKYMIYVINSARYELARQILSDLKEGAAVLLIADECHRYDSEQNRLIFEFLPYIGSCQNRFFSLGLSATLPSDQSLTYLSSVLGPKIYTYGMKQAASMHTICPYDTYHIGLSFLPEEQLAYQEISDRMSHLFSNLLKQYPYLKMLSVQECYEALQKLTHDNNKKTAEAASFYIRLSFQRKNLICLASARISCAADLIHRLPQNEKIIIFSERIEQAENLYQILQKEYPEKVGRYHSKMGQLANRNVLNRFREGTLRILISCKAADEGMDIPDASIGIILSGTSMQRQRIQRLGRILRKSEGKEYASLYYLHLLDTTEDHCFLPNETGSSVIELTYDPDIRQFSNPRYQAASSKLLSELQEAGTDTQVLDEVMRCLCLGSVRSDWISKHCDLDLKIKESRYTSEKNYWICMKKLQNYTSNSFFV